ncbi:uncharacterized protein LOC116341411 [Contarinia nasturtii]|uniref:uncharacterized protein LOC116341411 n=1 Tax=Contarinia nasturtii TaxID=265458 RepID=UPI0012D4A8DD|nr:uncharacterized protein LOC116341411 [Contarinia nasturtii]
MSDRFAILKIRDSNGNDRLSSVRLSPDEDVVSLLSVDGTHLWGEPIFSRPQNAGSNLMINAHLNANPNLSDAVAGLSDTSSADLGTKTANDSDRIVKRRKRGCGIDLDPNLIGTGRPIRSGERNPAETMRKITKEYNKRNLMAEMESLKLYQRKKERAAIRAISRNVDASDGASTPEISDHVGVCTSLSPKIEIEEDIWYSY